MNELNKTELNIMETLFEKKSSMSLQELCASLPELSEKDINEAISRLIAIKLIQAKQDMGKNIYGILYNRRELVNGGTLLKIPDLRHHLMIKSLFDQMEEWGDEKVLSTLQTIKLLLDNERKEEK